jgi:hypothetical protein
MQVRNANCVPGGPAHGSTIAATVNLNSNGANSSTTNTSNHAGNSSSTAAVGSIPQSLDQLLERQWEQGSQFLMEQAQHFDSKSVCKTPWIPVYCDVMFQF